MGHTLRLVLYLIFLILMLLLLVSMTVSVFMKIFSTGLGKIFGTWAVLMSIGLLTKKPK